MKRPLLVAAATATLVVGAVCGVAANAFASAPRPEHAVVSVRPLVVPTDHQPSSFAPDAGGRTRADGTVVVAARQAIDLDPPVATPQTPASADGAPSGSDTVAATPAVPTLPAAGATPATPAVPAVPAAPPKVTYGNNGNGNDNGKGTGNGKGNSSGKGGSSGKGESGSGESGDDSGGGKGKD
jgi:uncharacterized membrane protein YgcG